jgi:hypothetical protein
VEVLGPNNLARKAKDNRDKRAVMGRINRNNAFAVARFAFQCEMLEKA